MPATVVKIAAVAALLAGAAVHAQTNAAIKAAAEGFALSSAEGGWTLRLRGLLQVDGRVFGDDSAPDEDTEWLLRRVRPTLEGTFGERVGFRLMPDFGGGRTEVSDAWVDVKLGAGGLVLRAGKFKPPVGLERLRSANHLQLIERAFVTELLPRRDIGVQLSGGTNRLAWAAGVFNGVIDGGAADEDFDGEQEFAARVFAHPFAGDGRGGAWSGLGLGLAATYGSIEGSVASPLLPGYRSPGQNVVFNYRAGAQGTFADGDRLRVTPQFYWYRDRFGLLGEAIRVSQDVHRVGTGIDRLATLDHEAWQLTGNWFLTGEAAGFRDPSAVGAIELVARISELSADPASFTQGVASFANPDTGVQRADGRAIGVNWYPQAGIKASLVYLRTSFEGGAARGDRPDERALLARLQFYF